MTDKLKFQPKLGKWLTLLLGSVLIGLLVSGCGAEEPKVYRVGILSGLSFITDIADGFKAEMAELGYVEGENIVYDVQVTEFDMAVYQQTLQKFVDDEVDLIFVFPTEASIEAKAITQGTDVPVLFSFAQIEGMGLVESVREPGGNITGVRYPGPDLALKWFEIMRKLAPETTQMWVPYQRGYPIVGPQLEALYPAAEAAGVTLVEVPADNTAELEAELAARANAAELGPDAILIIAEPLGSTPESFAVIGQFATERGIPFGGGGLSMEDNEAVFGLAVVPLDAGKQAAPLADKILKGTPAGKIPVVSADSYLQLNYKVAQELGLNMDEGLLSQADEIIR